MRNRKAGILFFSIGGLIWFLAGCLSQEAATDPRGSVFIGSASCRKCHRAIYDSYVTTAHYHTTQSSSLQNVLGSFHKGANSFVYDSMTKIIMEQRKDGLYQVLYRNGRETEAHRMDITFGIRHAQSFLYWEGNKTFELPVSYYVSSNSWATSPGNSFNAANFKRFVGKNCYECHSSYVENKLTQGPDGIEETLDRNTVLLGIDCERCHGPGTNHVNYHLAYPDVKQAKYIIVARSLTRQQQLDACAECHSGNDKQKERSTFNFKIGDTLANFFLPWGSRHPKDSAFDVHGNQYQLMSESKCFLVGKTMACSTCHDPHADASHDLASYSAACISCHQNPDHRSLKMNESMARSINSNCIDCHMPLQPSRAIRFELSANHMKSAYLLRTHKIAVYPLQQGGL